MATKVFSEIASQLKSQIFQTSQSNLHARIFQTAQSNLRARIFQTAQSNLRARIFQSQRSNLQARVFQSQRSNFLARVFQTLASNLKVTVFQSAASSNVVKLGARAVTDLIQTVTTSSSTTFTFGNTQSVLQLSQFTFTVRNTGANPAVAKLQLSPDATNWMDDPGSQSQPISAGGMYIFTPGRFTKYARIAVRRNSATNTTLDIYAQGAV